MQVLLSCEGGTGSFGNNSGACDSLTKSCSGAVSGDINIGEMKMSLDVFMSARILVWMNL